MKIKETLKEFYSHLVKLKRSFLQLDSSLQSSLREHESRSSRVQGLIHSKEIINKIAEREMAHKHGRIRSSDNTIDRELEGLRKYVDILEESHKLLHEYLVLIRGMKEVLDSFSDRLHQQSYNQVRMVIAQIDVISHQLVSENRIIREEDLLIHNLTDTISEVRSELSSIFQYDNEDTIRDQRSPIKVIEEKFNNSDLNLRRIARRINSHNQLAKNHIIILLDETKKLLDSYESLTHSSSENEKDFRKAA